MPRGRFSPYKTKEERTRAKILYMRDYSRRNYPARNSYIPDPENRVDCSQAQYDPARDGYPQYSSLTAQLCGDPPIGRSALEQCQVVVLPVVRIERPNQKI